MQIAVAGEGAGVRARGMEALILKPWPVMQRILQEEIPNHLVAF